MDTPPCTSRFLQRATMAATAMAAFLAIASTLAASRDDGLFA